MVNNFFFAITLVFEMYLLTNQFEKKKNFNVIAL